MMEKWLKRSRGEEYWQTKAKFWDCKDFLRQNLNNVFTAPCKNLIWILERHVERICDSHPFEMEG